MADNEQEARPPAQANTDGGATGGGMTGGTVSSVGAAVIAKKLARRRAGGGGCHAPSTSNNAAAGNNDAAPGGDHGATPLGPEGQAPLQSLTNHVASTVGAQPGAAPQPTTTDAPPPPPGGLIAGPTAGPAATTTTAAPGVATAAPAVDDTAQRRAIATAMIRIVASAQATDGPLVVNELIRFELRALQALQARGVHVAVCRNSVTDYLPELLREHPRNWRPGATWATVPGTYWARTNEVVIAVVGAGTAAGAHVPRTGEQHGSFNVVLHESTHGIDRNRAPGVLGSSDPAFQAARTADLRTLDSYEGAEGTPGFEETYAESAARYFGGDSNDATAHPRLHAYWASHPLPAQGSPAATSGGSWV